MDVMLGQARLVGRLVAFTGFLALCVVVALSLSPLDRLGRQPINRALLTQQLMRLLCRLLGFRIKVNGQPHQGPALFVSNHISWTDIPVLAACAPLHFLAKREVGQWPLIGWLAGKAGTLYIRRRAGQGAAVRDHIAEVLGQGHSVLVFPEGTTTTGISVLPFHPRLLGSATRTGVPVQAMTIGYRRQGLPDPIVPFIGNDEFIPHLLRLLREPAVRVEIVLQEPQYPGIDESPDRLARRLNAAVADNLRVMHGLKPGDGSQPARPVSLGSELTPESKTA